MALCPRRNLPGLCAALLSAFLLTSAAAAEHAEPEPVLADLELRELLEPIGRYGLTFSERARALDGKPVRIRGFMVEQDQPHPGELLLAPRPVRLHEAEYGQADDLPAATVLVLAPSESERVFAHSAAPLQLTGTLELGPRESAGGRVFSVCLILAPTPLPHPEP